MRPQMFPGAGDKAVTMLSAPYKISHLSGLLQQMSEVMP